ncbi:hypothetical protein GIW50_05820 [Pseudomonas syringae]|uniref:Uncharacterized protein n=1 Tax=Pseudomonas syringae TaxID=317 RepID=A0A9Q3ZYI5_PSESX|nr:hypothetical protein [Pseudomonas syringae]MCF5062937.1 hypothetical protein [Pseudomonas syringae]MCF5073735.1 hypothetical protein [Pseudomonas syringae]MCF5117930.1 hypothetical protein [Pseudomonas syringae]MCF5379029.1 hypothetical protein [Pseudomonas syringae]
MAFDICLLRADRQGPRCGNAACNGAMLLKCHHRHDQIPRDLINSTILQGLFMDDAADAFLVLAVGSAALFAKAGTH